MDAGPGDVQHSADLGPISPELALVDPVLAERARALLPDPVEQPRRAAPAAVPDRPVDAPAPPPQPEPAAAATTRRWPRTLALAVLVFTAGAISGTFVGGGKDSSPPGVTFEAQTGQANPTVSTGATRPALRPPSVKRPKRRAKPAPATTTRRHVATTAWAPNVLGVEAQVDGPGVKLVWRRPADSAHVVVLRASAARPHGVVVFSGRASSYRDASPRSCTAYRYTIVNYDRHGHHSTGVPTSVVTQGCT